MLATHLWHFFAGPCARCGLQVQHLLNGVSAAKQTAQVARHKFRMPDDRLPEKLLFGQVKGRRPPDCPRSSFNDVAVRDCQLHRIKQSFLSILVKCIYAMQLTITHCKHH